MVLDLGQFLKRSRLRFQMLFRLRILHNLPKTCCFQYGMKNLYFPILLSNLSLSSNVSPCILQFTLSPKTFITCLFFADFFLPYNQYHLQMLVLYQFINSQENLLYLHSIHLILLHLRHRLPNLHLRPLHIHNLHPHHQHIPLQFQ